MYGTLCKSLSIGPPPLLVIALIMLVIVLQGYILYLLRQRLINVFNSNNSGWEDMEISIPLNTMNTSYLPIGKIVVVDKKGKIKWVWISANTITNIMSAITRRGGISSRPVSPQACDPNHQSSPVGTTPPFSGCHLFAAHGAGTSPPTFTAFRSSGWFKKPLHFRNLNLSFQKTL